MQAYGNLIILIAKISQTKAILNINISGNHQQLDAISFRLTFTYQLLLVLVMIQSTLPLKCGLFDH